MNELHAHRYSMNARMPTQHHEGSYCIPNLLRLELYSILSLTLVQLSNPLSLRIKKKKKINCPLWKALTLLSSYITIYKYTALCVSPVQQQRCYGLFPWLVNDLVTVAFHVRLPTSPNPIAFLKQPPSQLQRVGRWREKEQRGKGWNWIFYGATARLPIAHTHTPTHTSWPLHTSASPQWWPADMRIRSEGQNQQGSLVTLILSPSHEYVT